jgi:hypothetical protein
MSKDWGHRLQMYAYNRITEKVGREFDRHLNDWKVHTNNLIQYTRHAVDTFETHLKKVKEEIAAERQRNELLAMWVLALVSGPALSFVAGALQYRVAERLFGPSSGPTIRTTPNPKYVPDSQPKPPVKLPKGASTVTPESPPVKLPGKARLIDPSDPTRPAGQQVKMPPAGKTISPGRPQEPELLHKTVFDPNWSKTKGKILGELGSSLISSFMVLPSIRAKPPDQTSLESAINLVPNATTLADLRTKLENVWTQAQTVGKDAIEKFADTILEDSTWGDRLWEKLVKGPVPGPHGIVIAYTPAGPSHDEARFNACKELIRNLVDEQRAAWAKQYDPDKQEGWFYYGNMPVVPQESQFVHAVETELWAKWIDLEDFQHARVTEYGRIDREGNVEHKRSYDSYENPIGHSGIALSKILPRLRSLGVLPHGPSTLRGTKPPPMAAEIQGVLDNVDTKAELESINKWAENRKPVIFGGKLREARRIMGKLPVSGAD